MSKQIPAHWSGSLAQRAWHWWRRQLRDCVPQRLVRKKPERLYQWPLVENPRAAVDHRAVLLLQPGQALRHSLSLPTAAARDLDAILAYELDRFTPFTSQQAHAVVRREGISNGRLRLTLVIVRRDHLATWQAGFEEHGITLEHIDLLDEHGERLGLNLLPQQAPSGWSRRRARMAGGLGVLALLLVYAAMASVLHQREAAVQQRSAEVQALRGQTAELQGLRQQLTQADSAARSLTALKQRQATYALLLAELSTCLALDTWLQSLQVNRDGQVDLSGFTDHASGLLNQVKGCPHLVDARYQGVIQPDADSGKDRFYVRAQLLREPAHAAATVSP
ncbi:MAG TPA: PilN domain-containing protein [Pseudomonas sp.]|uniref:PilN domain-containing protein n=1 Tax=Pseudomonas sp. TaxID=306 RepID=UPI002B492E64|nr:PilN domain-containing protein [Pseudomonas sp.]HKS13362.1 PilN domain-containing protein [Pseudomonas sp.]